MKKNLSYAALAIMALVSCTSNDFVGDQKALENTETNRSISFGMGTPGITRADKAGSAAASDLSNQFIVWGEKNETSGAAATTGNLVFKNYLVHWIDNSAYTSTSNTKGWEYVGLKLDDPTASPATTSYSTNISPNSETVAQTIKYWDYGASTYTFTAVSALPADITAGNVKITKTESGTNVSDKGYSVALTAGANLDKLFFAERINIATSNNTDRSQVNQYGGNVTFRFHNMATKVRVAMYETVPGYSVTIKEFKVADAADPAFSAMTTSKTDKFAANLQNCVKGTAGTMTVKYVATAGTTLNHPTVSFAPTATAANVLELGEGLKENITIGENSTSATYDRADGADSDSEPDYTSVFPNETNTQNLKLKLSYTLTAPVTGETIEITDKTAEIPAQYLQWKPGYAYTYIFKITDDNLYPITFDAVEVISEDGQSEYITTVTEPSITTFGAVYNTTSSKYTSYQAGQNEYLAQTSPNQLDIFATLVEDGAVVVPNEGTNVNYYSIAYKTGATDAEKLEKPITESSVAESLSESVANPLIVCTKNNDLGAPVTSVPGEDGITKTINAVKFENLPAGIYAVEYITTQTYNTTGSTYASQEAFSAAGTLYTDADGTTPATSWANSSTTYYKRGTIKKHEKTYKVIKVVAAP